MAVGFKKATPTATSILRLPQKELKKKNPSSNSVNVSYQRVEHISEWNTLPDSMITILNCRTTTLGTNYNYIRNS